MPCSRCCGWILVAALVAPPSVRSEEKPATASPRPLPEPTVMSIVPAECRIVGADAVQRLLVTGRLPGDQTRTADYSRKAAYTSSDPKVAEVTPDGVVLPRGSGSTVVRAVYAGRSVS